ncbi:MAG: NAD(P)/FAD-dependent oxidoreductase [Acidobacteriota bacterium]
MTGKFDAVIIGAGHNGLVTAGYLARAGLKVCALERRSMVGGACVTEEVFPGFKVSTTSYVCSLLSPKIIRDLEMRRYGYEVLERHPSSFSVFPNGSHLFLGGGHDMNVREIRKFSARDAGRYPEYERMLQQLGAAIEPILELTPPDVTRKRLGDVPRWLSLVFAARRLGRIEHMRGVGIMTASVAEILDQWFESEELKSALATDGIIGAYGGPMTPGTAFVLLHHVMGETNGRKGVWGYVRGGMGMITQSLADSARAHGAVIRTGPEVEQIHFSGERADGVVLEDGEEIGARIVISNADARRTFLGMIPSGKLDSDFIDEVKRIKFDSASLKLNLALGELPDFKCLPGTSPGPQHRGTIHISPSVEYIERAWDDAKYGRPSRKPMLECTIPTVIDDTLAPPGRHIMSLFVQYAPYRLANGMSWDEEKEKFADRCIDILAEYAPNIKGAILGRHILTPLDLERDFALTGGNIFHGSMSLDQLFFLRPVPGYADYRTPLRNLYMCGSGTHPGGGILGLPGHNAAREILKDWRSVRSRSMF